MENTRNNNRGYEGIIASEILNKSLDKLENNKYLTNYDTFPIPNKSDDRRLFKQSGFIKSKNGLRVRFLGLENLPATDQNALNPVQVTLKITSDDDEKLWSFFESRRSDLEKLIREQVHIASEGGLEIKSLHFRKGSIDIIFVLQAVWQTAKAIATAVKVYRVLRDLHEEIVNKIIPALESALEGFFENFATPEKIVQTAKSPGFVGAILGLVVFFLTGEILKD